MRITISVGIDDNAEMSKVECLFQQITSIYSNCVQQQQQQQKQPLTFHTMWNTRTFAIVCMYVICGRFHYNKQTEEGCGERGFERIWWLREWECVAGNRRSRNRRKKLARESVLDAVSKMEETDITNKNNNKTTN